MKGIARDLILLAIAAGGGGYFGGWLSELIHGCAL